MMASLYARLIFPLQNKKPANNFNSERRSPATRLKATNLCIIASSTHVRSRRWARLSSSVEATFRRLRSMIDNVVFLLYYSRDVSMLRQLCNYCCITRAWRKWILLQLLSLSAKLSRAPPSLTAVADARRL